LKMTTDASARPPPSDDTVHIFACPVASR
jgi:hypothetical protein